MTNFDPMPLAQAAFYALVCIGFMFVAKVIGNALTRYDDDKEIKQNGNVAVAIRTVGFFSAVGIGMAGALRSGVPEFGKDIPIFLLDGAVVIVSLIVAHGLLRVLVFPGVDFAEKAQQGQISGGIVEASLYIATALLLNGVFGSEGGNIFAGVLWVIGGQVALIVSMMIYRSLAPYNLSEELSKANVAAALALASRTISIAIILRGILSGDSGESIKSDVLYVAIYFAFGMLLLSLSNLVADLLFLPKYKVKEAIVENQNVAAIAKIAGVQIAVAIVVAAVIK